MNILQLSPQVPYPLTDGGKVGIFNITKHLAKRGHQITMLALEQTRAEERKPLEDVCELVTVPHSNKNNVFAALKNLFSDMSYNIQKYVSPLYLDSLRNILASQTFDVVHVDHLHMSPYGVYCKQQFGLPIVLREHNVESAILERYAENNHTPVFRQWLDMQARRIRAFEAKMTAQFDMCCTITENDTLRLRQLNPNVKTHTIPAGVEERYFESPSVQDKLPSSIALVGNFAWLPNKDALMWFLSGIFPKIQQEQPDSVLHIIGKNIPPNVQQMNSRQIVIRGFVPDIKDELQRYELAVVPLRIGGGMRLKIVESFAMGVPVVSTSIGCEGILGKDNEHLLVADTEQQFASQVVRLLRNSPLRKKLAENAYRLAVSHYRWERIAEEFEKVYLQARKAVVQE
ncbi:MAG: glycosyltransferase family 4 protein [Ignavibacteriae bacterium]|nr:glycosyltransferase family 4 protein [Ignavibacteriota bacterium]